MATPSGTLAWKTPWTEERGRPMGLQRGRHDWATSLHFTDYSDHNVITFCACVLSHFSRVSYSTVAHRLYMNCSSMDCSPLVSSIHRDSPGKNTGVGCHALLQGFFLTQRLNPHLSLTFPALASGFFTTGATWEAPYYIPQYIYFITGSFYLLTSVIHFAYPSTALPKSITLC